MLVPRCGQLYNNHDKHVGFMIDHMPESMDEVLLPSKPLHGPLAPLPPRTPRLQDQVRHHPIHHHANPQCHQIQPGIGLEIVLPQHILPRLDGTPPVGRALVLLTREDHPAEGVRSQIAERVLDGTEMVEGLQEGRHLQRHDATHHGGHGEKHRGDVDGEPRVPEEGVEHDAHALAAVDDGEAVEDQDEVQRRGPGQARREDGEQAEEQGREDLKGDLGQGVLQEEGLDAVGVVVVFPVEDVALGGVDGHALEHADEIQRGDLLEEPESGGHAGLGVFKRREEEGDDHGEGKDLGRAGDDGDVIAAEVDDGALHQHREGDSQGRHVPSKATEFCWGCDIGGFAFHRLLGLTPIENEGADFFAAGSLSVLVLEVDGDEVECEICRIGRDRTIVTQGCKVW